MLLCMSIALVAARDAHAEIILETASGWDGHSAIGNLVVGDTWGQTFRTPDNVSHLSEASFWVQTYPVNPYGNGPYTFDITGYLMAWDGEKGIQPILADSKVSVNTSVGEFSRVDFDFQGVSVAENSQYVLFFMVSPTPVLNYVNFGFVDGNPYADGGLSSPYAGSFYLISLLPWGRSVDDLAFELRFAAVPEPSTFGLGLLGSFALLAVSLRRGRP